MTLQEVCCPDIALSISGLFSEREGGEGEGKKRGRKTKVAQGLDEMTCSQYTVSDRQCYFTYTSIAGSFGEYLENPESKNCKGKSPASPDDDQVLVTVVGDRQQGFLSKKAAVPALEIGGAQPIPPS